MQTTTLGARCPYKIGDRVEVAFMDGVAFTGFPRRDVTALMQITDILTIHSLKGNEVTFAYELDSKKVMMLVDWQDFIKQK